MTSRRWVVLTLVFFGILISYVDRSNLSLAATSIMADFHLSPESMGLLLSAFFWTYGLCQIPAGLIVDRFGIRWVYAGAFLVWSLASAAVAISRTQNDIFALRLALGFAESIGPLASMTFIRQNFKGPEQGLPVSIYIAGQTIGPACGALIGAHLISTWGWRALFACTGLGALLWIPFWAKLAPRPVPRPVERTKTEWPSVQILHSATFWALSACVVFFSYYWYFVLTWMPAYLTMNRGYSTRDMGAVLSAPLFTMAVWNVVAGALADRLVKRWESYFRVRVLFASIGLTGASAILLLNVLPGRAPVLPILFTSICFFGVANANYWAIAQYVVPSAIVGRAIGYLNTLAQLAGAIAPWLTGKTLGPERNFQPAVLIAGLCPLVAVGLLMLAGPRRLDRFKAELAGNRELRLRA